jgi:hypothetical protein
VNQRWTRGQSSFRHPDEVIDTAAHEVAPIVEVKAKAFVCRHHYSGSYPANRFDFGLFRRGDLVGVATFSHPVNNLTITNNLPGVTRATDGVELGRFVLLDEVPGNGETWFLARCFELLRPEGLAGVVSFSDPHPRTTDAGAAVFPGHIGTIYQAHNAVYLGRSDPDTLFLLPDGRSLNKRTLSKARRGECGRAYVARILQSYGADEPRGDFRAWVDGWVGRPGNHKYVWGLSRAVRRLLPAGQSYPKRFEVAA